MIKSLSIYNNLSQISFTLYTELYINHVIVNVRLSDCRLDVLELAVVLVHVKQVVILYVEHESSPFAPALCVLCSCCIITRTTLPLSGWIISPSGQNTLPGWLRHTHTALSPV